MQTENASFAGKRNCAYKCVHVSDPHAQRLADATNVIATLSDLDRGLAEARKAIDEFPPEAREEPVPAPSVPPQAPRSAASTAAAASRTAARVINAARALNAAAVPPAPPAAPARPSPPPAPVPPSPPHTVGDLARAVPPPSMTFMRVAPGEPHARRRLLNVFPESALEPERPSIPALGTALGPLPPPSLSAPTPTDPPSQLDALLPEAFYDIRERPFSVLLIVTAFALLVLAGAGGALWVSRDAARRTILRWENIPSPPGGPVRRLPVPIAPIPLPVEIADSSYQLARGS